MKCFNRTEFAFFCLCLTLSTTLSAQNLHPVALITGPIEETKLVTLSGNTRPEATLAHDAGAVAEGFKLDHMLLQLKRSPDQEAAVQNFIDNLHNPESPNFHKWLTPAQFADQFGVASDDLATVTAWLASKGFVVNGSPASGMVIDFSGTASQVRNAFHTEIHNLSVGGVNHIANMSDPKIPSALSPLVAGIVSLHDFRPHAQLVKKNPLYTYTYSNATYHALVPGDIETIYNINPLLAQGYSGTGQSIMVVEDTYLYATGDWNVFRKAFGLARTYPHGSLSQVSPAGPLTCTNPGFQGSPKDPGYGDDGEAAIDVEWATAAAPNAAIILAACADTNTTFGGLIALENSLNGRPDQLPSVVSISYGESESFNGTAANLAYYFVYQQAVLEGVSIFVSSGDENAAASDSGNPATHGITVSGYTSTPYNVSVGGLDFGYTANQVAPTNYWSASNKPNYSSALGYISEIPWNDSCAGELVAGFLGFTPLSLCNNSTVTSSSGQYHGLLNSVGGSGGPSGCAIGVPSVWGEVNGTCIGYAKPWWQAGLFGNPNDGVRDIPDVSLFASNGFWDAYYVTCWSNPNTDPNVGGGFLCTGAPDSWAGFGGTSVSSPIMAGIQALVNQKTGSRWGNPNTVYYSLAKKEFGSSGSSACDSNSTPLVGSPCIFHDITEGDNVGVCKASAGVLTGCYTGGNVYGVLSTSKSSDKPAYRTHVGWDFSSGIGSVDAYNLAMKWPTAASLGW